MLKIILLVVALIVVTFLIFAASKPDTFRVTRKLVVKAAPDKVFAEINNFNRWLLWSPWEKKDPAMQRSFSGSDFSVGSIYEWNGNNDVGQGRMEITESNNPHKITIQLDFFKPFEAHNFAVFTLTPTAEGTLINWEMYGPQNFIGKVMCIFMDMDKMVGTDFEAGLENLKKITE